MKEITRKEIILLCAKSASGKDYIAKALNLNLVISHTTRAPRKGEFQHIHKHFHNHYEDLGDTIAYTKRGKYEYWIREKDLDYGDVYIIDLPGIKHLLNWKQDKYKFKIVYIKCNLFKRIWRLLKREKSIFEVISRLWIDYKDFKDIKKYADVTIGV